MPKTIEEIYTEYKIMPSLREHMYRVAAVASILCDHFLGSIDRKSVLHACLLHDISNIIKFDLGKFPSFVQPEGLDYWQRIKDECIKKYETTDTNIATLKIAKNVGASMRTLELLNACGFGNAIKTFESKEFEKKICLYSDMRASPTAVVSLSERLDESSERYKNDPNAFHEKEKEDRINAVIQIEKEIFEKIDIAPSFIDERNVQNIIPHLKNMHIE